MKKSKNILLGIGNRLRSDDGAGSILAERFNHEEWMSLDGADVPENQTGVIKRTRPDILILVDACDLGEEPGTVRRIPLDLLSRDSGFNTHSAPLAFLIEYLNSFAGEIIFLGIQPGNTDFGEGLSKPVSEGVDFILEVLRMGSWEDIVAFKGG